jgi:hypothetical protein
MVVQGCQAPGQVAAAVVVVDADLRARDLPAEAEMPAASWSYTTDGERPEASEPTTSATALRVPWVTSRKLGAGQDAKPRGLSDKRT